MNKIREITISGYTGDADYVGDAAAAEPADSEFLDLSAGHVDVEWFMDFVDGSGDRVGVSGGTFNAQEVWRTQHGGKTVYSRGALQTSVSAGLRQLVYDDTGGASKRSSGKFTVRITSAIASPPAGAITARIFAQEV